MFGTTSKEVSPKWAKKDFFSGLDNSEKLVQAEKHSSRNNNEFKYAHSTLEYSPTYKNTKVKELLSFDKNGFEIGNAAHTIARSSRETSKSVLE